MQSRNKISSTELESILTRFISEEDLSSIKLRINSLPGLSKTTFLNEKIDFTKLELLLTFVRKHLSLKEYCRLLLNLGKYFLGHGEIKCSQNMFEKIINLSSSNDDLSELLGYANNGIAEIFAIQGNWNSAKQYIHRSADIFSKTKNQKGITDTKILAGTFEAEKGRIQSAKKHFEKVIPLVESRKDSEQKAKLFSNLAVVNNILGEFSKSEKYYIKALNYFEVQNDWKRIAEITHNLGMLKLKQTDYDSAIKYFNKSIKLADSYKIYPILGIAYLGLAETLINQNKVKEATLAADNAIENAEAVNDRLTMADSLKIKGIIARLSGDLDGAETYFNTSLGINEELKNEMNFAETALELAILHNQRNDSVSSEKFKNKAILYYKKNRCYKELGRIKSLFKRSSV